MRDSVSGRTVSGVAQGMTAMHSISTFALGTTSAATTTVDLAGGSDGQKVR